jgi:hypothetical protein
MGDGVFNQAKGSVGEMALDDNTKFLVLLLETAEADTTLVDYDDVGALLVGTPIEAAFTSYARKTPITATRTVDDTNDRVDVDIPDQTWSPAGNGTNETLAKLVVAYENAAADASRVPCTHHDFVVTTDGSDLTAQFNAAGFYRAA